MRAWLDSDWLRALGYALVAAAGVAAYLRERRRADHKHDLWPTFWLLTAILYLGMAIGRTADLADLATKLGRHEAIVGGWYAHRRKFQAIAVGSVALLWLATVSIALWRVPARRRRYLPAVLVAVSLMGYAGIRVISLHQVDSVLYRRHLWGYEIAKLVELFGIACALAVTFWQPRSRRVSASEISTAATTEPTTDAPRATSTQVSTRQRQRAASARLGPAATRE